MLRPRRHQFERLDDYLNRLASLNGFSSGALLTKYLRDWAGSEGVIVRIRGRDKSEVLARILSRYFARTVELKSFDLSGFVKFNPHLKICKTCLAENKVVMFYWYLKTYLFCHLHQEKLVQLDAEERERGSFNEFTLHPIVDFLERNDPWHAYLGALKNVGELQWLCRQLKEFFSSCLMVSLHIVDAQQWIDKHRLAESTPFEKFDIVTSLIATGSTQLVNDIRLVAALTLWQRMVPDHLLKVAGVGATDATEASLGWASSQLTAYEPMLMFICDAHHAPKHTPALQLRDYIPFLACVSEEVDRGLRKAIYSCGVTTEILAIRPSGVLGSLAIPAPVASDYQLRYPPRY